MRVAALERFPDPSRRCEASSIARPGDDVLVWDLPALRADPAAVLGGLPVALARWVAGGFSPGQRRRLFRACLRTGGGRLGALVVAPELWHRVDRGEVQRVACFSAKELPLAELLAEQTREAADDMIARGTKYFGEFAFELLAVIPYAYWLHLEGRLEFTIASRDTRCLYYFSKHHEERPGERRYVPITEYPIGERGALRYDRKGFPAMLDTRRWVPPPYRKAYRDDRFRWEREPCVVCNKASDERYLRRGFAVNFLDTDLLLEVIGRLRRRYQVIYDRPRAGDLVNDHQAVREAGDIDAVARAYPDVMTIQQLHARHPDLTFNELQLRLFASSERFVSVLGGASYLASYFGGTNVVYARRGWEVSCGAFDSWFDRFSGARVLAAKTPRELVDTIERELL